MALVPCPHCGSELTESERRRDACPICKKKFSKPADVVKSMMAGRLGATAESPSAPQPVPPIRATARRLGGVFVLLLGLGLVWLVGKEFTKWIGSGGWPKASATITQSEVAEAIAKSRRGGTSVVYRPSIRFKYTADGREYESHRIGFGADVMSSDSVDLWMSEAAAKRVVARFPKEAQVDVRYDPRDASYAVLTRTMDIAAWGMLALSCFISYLGLRLLTSALLSDSAVANTKVWLFTRSPHAVDLIVGGIPLAIFAVAQFMPGLFR